MVGALPWERDRPRLARAATRKWRLDLRRAELDDRSVEPATTKPPHAPPTPHLAGWLAVALIDAVLLARDVPRRTSIGARIAAHFFDALHLLALGLAVTALAAVLRRVRPAV